jgi:hypothetical protein
MASFSATVDTPWTPQQAFEFMADAANFERWDPGVLGSRQVVGDAPAEGAEYDVEVRSIGSPLVLRYRTTRFEPPAPARPGVVRLEAEHPKLRSIDRIEIVPTATGSSVTYDADLRLRGPWRAFSPLMAIGFRRIGERAADGLTTALEGERA